MTDKASMIEALAIRDMLGAHGSLWLTERISACAAIGDAAEAARLQRIATYYQRLQLSS